MANKPKKACRGCLYCNPYYGNKNKFGKRIISKYWCIKKSTTCSDPKECSFRKEKD